MDCISDVSKKHAAPILRVEVNKVRMQSRHSVISYMYVVGSKSFRRAIQKPRQMENAVRDI